MNEEIRFWDIIRKLPPDRVREVCDFASWLLEQENPPQREEAPADDTDSAIDAVKMAVYADWR